jgi:enamine deaminase RidA (YjgF/YER057c/UK114 family)
MTRLATLLAALVLASAPATAQEVRHVNPPGLYDASKFYTHVITVPASARTIYIAGQVGVVQSGAIEAKDMAGQIAQAFRNLRVAIEAGGARPEHVVKITALFVDYKREDLEVFTRELHALFPKDKLPTSTAIGVQKLARDGLLFEIEAIAAVP